MNLIDSSTLHSFWRARAV